MSGNTRFKRLLEPGRIGKIKRDTSETSVSVEINLDGCGSSDISTGIRMLDHLLSQIAQHGVFDIKLYANGSDKHHVIEDVAICLGRALRKGVGDGVGINRFGYAIVPMDCSLAFAAIDLVRRPYCKIDLTISGEAIEDTMIEDIIHFLETLTFSLEGNIHIWVQYGDNDHHKVEAAFKALALSLREAVTVNPERRSISSAK